MVSLRSPDGRFGATRRRHHRGDPASRDEAREEHRDPERDRSEHERGREARLGREACRCVDVVGHDRGGDLAEKAPPTVLMIVFMPVASPVWCWGTASTIRFAIDANDSPMPSPSSVTARMICHSSECATASSAKLSPAKAVPSSSGSFEPRRPASVPAIGPATSITAADGSMNRPAPVTPTAKP